MKVTMNTIKQQLLTKLLKITEYEDYKDFLFNVMHKRNEINRIQSEDYIIGTYLFNKVSLSCYDNKKYTLEDGYCKLLRFHKSTS